MQPCSSNGVADKLVNTTAGLAGKLSAPLKGLQIVHICRKCMYASVCVFEDECKQ